MRRCSRACCVKDEFGSSALIEIEPLTALLTKVNSVVFSYRTIVRYAHKNKRLGLDVSGG